LRALHVDDDTSLNPWTFRMFFLGTQLRRETNLSVLLVLHLGFEGTLGNCDHVLICIFRSSSH